MPIVNNESKADPRIIPTTNNMDALRLLFACLVVGAHTLTMRSFIDSNLAVRGFFVLSGFLVFMSFEQSSSTSSYLIKRARRICPAYLVVVLAVALAGAVISSLPLSSYLGKDLAFYLMANLTFLNFLHPTLPGVFGNNPVMEVNGALWTIKIEVAFYISVPVIVWLAKKFGRAFVLSGCFALSLLYQEIFVSLASTSCGETCAILAKQLPGQLAFFVSGATLYYYFSSFRRRPGMYAAVGAALLLLGWRFGVPGAYPSGLALVVIAAAFGPQLGNAGRFGDFSYGVYIWHCPILQYLVAAGLFAAHPRSATAAGFALSLVAAGLSWHLVEKRWLHRSSHYVKAAGQETGGGFSSRMQDRLGEDLTLAGGAAARESGNPMTIPVLGSNRR